MFSHASLPSKIYSYGANVAIVGADVVEEQMRLAHRYRNVLVELERSRRAKVEEALKTLSPELVVIEVEITQVSEEIDRARELIRSERAQARKRLRNPIHVETIRVARQKRKALYSNKKELRTALFTSEAWKSKQDEIDEWRRVEGKRLRSECGLYWGTYLHVEQSMMGCRSGAPPKFMRWTGDGHLAVQLQKGLSISEVFAGLDTRLRIEKRGEGVWIDGKRRPRKLGNALVHFRVGSKPNGSPILATIPFVLHRDLPSDTEIKWAHLIRRRVGTHCEWRIQFVLSRKSGWAHQDCAVAGKVGIDVGWRMKDDGSLRTAYWCGDDGREGELVLSASWLGEMRRVEGIRSIRDKNLDVIRATLTAWLRESKNIPEWLREQAVTLHQWKSPARFAALTLKWREARFDGDTVFEAVESWRKRDKHLYEFEANLRDQLQRNREAIYREFAASMRRDYKTAIIEALDLRDFHVLPEAEEPPPEAALRRHTRDACLSLLFRCLKESMSEAVKVPAQNTTKLCPKCGVIGEFSRVEIIRVCPGCGDKDDQDRVAALNLLGTSATVVV